jgi:hypothetical protein
VAKKNRKKKKKGGFFRRLKQLSLILLLLLALPTINWIYQASRKPSEFLSFFDSYFIKTPVQTWASYKDDFRKNATSTITPDFLAALAQIETNGNPIASTFWRFQPSKGLGSMYAPASSAVGLFQITDPTFKQIQEICINDGEVEKMGKWHEFNKCWWNRFYSRLIPQHSISMTAAHLEQETQRVLSRVRKRASRPQRQALAAIIHLCGTGKGLRFARGGFRPGNPAKCGSHSTPLYLSRLKRYQRLFQRISK